MRASGAAVPPVTATPARIRLRVLVLACLAGALAVLGFAPLGWWPLQLGSLALLFYLCGIDFSVRRSALIGAAYGFGWCCAGMHWLYISLHRYGDLPAALTVAAVCLLSVFLGLYSALATGIASWLRKRWALPLQAFLLLVLPALWALSEWLRGWIFTGFPWAASGYAHNISPLAGYAPVIGVYGVGGLAAVCAGALALLTQRARRIKAGVLLVLVLGAGYGLQFIDWTHPAGHPISLRLLQGNVAQEEKFSPAHTDQILAEYRDLVQAGSADLIAAPETAIVEFPQQLPPDYLPALAAYAQRSGSHLLLGIPLWDEAHGATNSTIGLAPTAGELPYRYDKHHLVPFGEFIPLGFHWFVALMNIPLGDFSRGAVVQAPFAVKDQRVLPNICYEDLFGEEIAAQLRGQAQPATLLLNVSNLAWFGESVAIAQHLQISQMRTLETGRPMLRATNSGATAVIGPHGAIEARLAPYIRGTLATTVQGMAGTTPYIMFGNAGMLALAAAALGAAWLFGRKNRKSAAKTTTPP